jgi:hypothetical protein
VTWVGVHRQPTCARPFVASISEANTLLAACFLQAEHLQVLVVVKIHAGEFGVSALAVPSLKPTSATAPARDAAVMKARRLTCAGKSIASVLIDRSRARRPESAAIIDLAQPSPQNKCTGPTPEGSPGLTPGFVAELNRCSRRIHAHSNRLHRKDRHLLNTHELFSWMNVCDTT